MEIIFIPRRFPTNVGDFVKFSAIVDGANNSILVSEAFLSDRIGGRDELSPATLCSIFDRHRDLIERIAQVKLHRGDAIGSVLKITPDDIDLVM